RRGTWSSPARKRPVARRSPRRRGEPRLLTGGGGARRPSRPRPSACPPARASGDGAASVNRPSPVAGIFAFLGWIVLAVLCSVVLLPPLPPLRTAVWCVSAL